MYLCELQTVHPSKMKVLVLLVLLGLFAQLCESHPGGGDPGPSTSGLKKRKHDEIESECENDNMEIDSNPENSDLEDLDGLSDFEYDPEEEDPDDASADSDEEKRERPKTKKQKTEKKRRVNLNFFVLAQRNRTRRNFHLKTYSGIY